MSNERKMWLFVENEYISHRKRDNRLPPFLRLDGTLDTDKQFFEGYFPPETGRAHLMFPDKTQQIPVLNGIEYTTGKKIALVDCTFYQGSERYCSYMYADKYEMISSYRVSLYQYGLIGCKGIETGHGKDHKFIKKCRFDFPSLREVFENRKLINPDREDTTKITFNLKEMNLTLNGDRLCVKDNVESDDKQRNLYSTVCAVVEFDKEKSLDELFQHPFIRGFQEFLKLVTCKPQKVSSMYVFDDESNSWEVHNNIYTNYNPKEEVYIPLLRANFNKDFQSILQKWFEKYSKCRNLQIATFNFRGNIDEHIYTLDRYNSICRSIECLYGNTGRKKKTGGKNLNIEDLLYVFGFSLLEKIGVRDFKPFRCMRNHIIHPDVSKISSQSLVDGVFDIIKLTDMLEFSFIVYCLEQCGWKLKEWYDDKDVNRITVNSPLWLFLYHWERYESE